MYVPVVGTPKKNMNTNNHPPLPPSSSLPSPSFLPSLAPELPDTHGKKVWWEDGGRAAVGTSWNPQLDMHLIVKREIQ